MYFEGAISDFHPNLLRQFGGSLAMAALAMTADDWTRATPSEWDHAMNAGEVAMVIGQMAGAHTDAHQQRRDTSAAARSAR